MVDALLQARGKRYFRYPSQCPDPARVGQTAVMISNKVWFVDYLGSASRSPQDLGGELGDGDFGFTADIVNLSLSLLIHDPRETINEIAYIKEGTRLRPVAVHN